jgi:hypothetical protein
VRPLLHDGASTKASLTFNSTPTFPGIDFRCGSLLSFCVDGLLETQRLPATTRPYGNRRSVLAWSGWFRHLTDATSCRTSGLQTGALGPANTGCFGITFGSCANGIKLGKAKREVFSKFRYLQFNNFAISTLLRA